LAAVVTEILAGVPVFNAMVMALDMAGFNTAQVRFEVIWQVTKSPLTGI
jgi:hypothetical protein